MFTSDAGGGRAGADVTGSFAYRWFSCPQRRQRRKEKKERERETKQQQQQQKETNGLYCLRMLATDMLRS